MGKKIHPSSAWIWLHWQTIQLHKYNFLRVLVGCQLISSPLPTHPQGHLIWHLYFSKLKYSRMVLCKLWFFTNMEAGYVKELSEQPDTAVPSNAQSMRSPHGTEHTPGWVSWNVCRWVTHSRSACLSGSVRSLTSLWWTVCLKKPKNKIMYFISLRSTALKQTASL